MKKYRLIVMSFDGEIKKESLEFESIENAWDYCNDLGSKWFFYPFAFVTTESYKTIKSAGFPLNLLKWKRVKTVQKLFDDASKQAETQGMNADEYAFAVIEGRL